MILRKIAKFASELDECGFFEEADVLTGFLEKAAVLTLSKNAAPLEIRISVNEHLEKNEWLADFNVWQNGQLKIANLEQVSSPIFQNEELRAAGNKQPGIDAMKQQLRAHIKGFRGRHQQHASAIILIENPLFK